MTDAEVWLRFVTGYAGTANPGYVAEYADALLREWKRRSFSATVGLMEVLEEHDFLARGMDPHDINALITERQERYIRWMRDAVNLLEEYSSMPQSDRGSDSGEVLAERVRVFLREVKHFGR